MIYAPSTDMGTPLKDHRNPPSSGSARVARERSADWLREWESRLRGASKVAGGLSHYVLIDSAPRLLEAIAAELETGVRSHEVEESGEDHAVQRSGVLGYSLALIRQEYDLLGQILTEGLKQGGFGQEAVLQQVSRAIERASLAAQDRYQLARSEREAEFWRLFKSAAVGIVEVDPKTYRFIKVNPEFCRMLGYRAEELVGVSVLDVTYPEDRDRGHEILASLEHSESGVIRIEKRYLRRDGKALWCEVSIARDEAGQGTTLRNVGVALDITQRKKAEEELKAALDRLREFREALDTASIVAITDARGVILYVNDRFCQISKYSREELVGRTHRLVNSGYHTPVFFQELWRVISSGRVWRGEIKNRAKDGSTYWVDTVIIPFLSPEGQIVQYMAIRNDITLRMRALEELQQERGLRERFVSTLTHDLRTPLTTARMNVQLALRRSSSPDAVLRHASKALEALDRMDRMIQDLLDVHRIRAGGGLPIQAEACELSQLLREVCDELTGIFGAHFRLIGSGVLQGFWAPSELRRVIENLGSNAAKYGQPGAPIEVDWGRFGNQEAWFSFRNQGVPIPVERIPELFNSFLRGTEAAAHGKGWGLGLTLVKGVVEAHGGTIRATSSEEAGTLFEVRLPLDSRRFGRAA